MSVASIFGLAMGGAAGTLARYWLSGVALRMLGTGWPWGTFAVNAVGCLMYGFIWTLAEQRMVISPETRVVVLTGFMGAFTTFSTFAFDTAALARDGDWLLSACNLLAHNGIGLALILGGMAMGRAIVGQ